MDAQHTPAKRFSISMAIDDLNGILQAALSWMFALGGLIVAAFSLFLLKDSMSVVQGEIFGAVMILMGIFLKLLDRIDLRRCRETSSPTAWLQ
jgi:nitrate reductase gamma subunit